MTLIQQAKNNWFKIFIVACILVFVFITKPFGCNKPGEPTIVTVTKTDTQYIQQPPVYVPQYIPVASNSQSPIVIPPSYQPSADLEGLLKQYNELAAKFLTIHTYEDSIKLKDSTGKQVGIVNLRDIVSENKIQSRNPSYQLNFPHTTTIITTTITQPYKPRFQIIVGGTITGQQDKFINGGYLSIGFKNKRDGIYTLNGGVLNVNGIKPIYGLTFLTPIKLRK